MTKQFEILNDPNAIPLLDHGFCRIVEHMGSDAAIVQAARVSYGAGTKTVNEDRGLIRYLLRHRHTSPIEMCEIKFHIRAPIFVIRQWARHRTASTNEESARYSEMSDEFYMPETDKIQPQAKDNKQGRAGELSEFNASGAQWLLNASYEHSLQTYRLLLGDRQSPIPDTDLLYDPYEKETPLLSDDFDGIARESARMAMPLASYSEFYWKVNLHNAFHFLKLRDDPHAQYEIRVYAEAMTKLIEPLFPMALEAYYDYIKGAITLSRMEKELIMELAKSPLSFAETFNILSCQYDSVKAFGLSRGMSVREIHDFAQTFNLTI